MTSTSMATQQNDSNRMNPSGRFRAQFWKTELCRFWRSGCRNGKLCPFAHGEEELCGRPDLCKTSLCQRWAKGACPLEAGECRFAHGRLDLRATPNFMHGAQGEGNSNGQDMEGYGKLETEAVLLSTNGNNGSNSHASQSGGGSSHPPPRMWEEHDNIPDAQNFMNRGAAPEMSPWANRNHANGNRNEAILDQMQAVLGQRDWQWSPEYGDVLQDGDARQQLNGRQDRSHAAKMMPAAPITSVGAGIGGPMATSTVPSNGHTQPLQLQQQTQQLQQLLLGGGDSQHGVQSQLPQLPQQPQQQQHWGGLPLRETPMPANGGWVAGPGMQAHGPLGGDGMTYAGGMDQGYSAAAGPQVSPEFPHAITAPSFNTPTSSSVPQEVRAIWN